MSKNITPLNDKNQRHGYWERYNYNGNLIYKCTYHKGKKVGIEEWNSYDGKLKVKTYNL
jgi:antitoxin component YwqK of YwqJK toxin-antitoxin module